MRSHILLVAFFACGGGPPREARPSDLENDGVAQEDPAAEEDAPVEAPPAEPDPPLEEPGVEEGAEEAPAQISVPPVVHPEKPEDTNVQDVLEKQQVVVEDLKYDLAGLEWFLDDQAAYQALCPQMEWSQPPIETYREHPHSYLPDGCVEDAEKEERELLPSKEPREELPARE